MGAKIGIKNTEQEKGQGKEGGERREGGKAGEIYGDGEEEQRRGREEGQVFEGRKAAAAAAREAALILQPLI